MPNRIELRPGTKVNSLTVLSELPPRLRSNGRPRRVLLCKCVCGIEKEILFQSLTVGRVVSCGCHQRMIVKNGRHALKHGLSNHPLFTVWRCMKNRCYDPSHKGYKYYGARGITICEEWKEKPDSFIDWVLKNGWRKGLQIDRINVNGNYEPSNCRMVTPYENLMNRRCTKKLFAGTKT
jgi:hypothetical protein